MSLFVKMDVQAVQNGLIEKVGGVKHFSVLAAIASFANSKGEAFPSQDKLAEMVGMSRKTINKYIGDLRDIRIDGEPLFVVITEPTPKGRRNKYVLTPKSGFSFGKGIVTEKGDNVTDEGQGVVTEGLQEQEISFNNNHLEQEKEKEIVFDNAKEVIVYFQQKYSDKYNKAYSVSWGRDSKMVKTKLLDVYSDNEIKSIVDFVIDEYDSRWANAKFPRPTLGQLCTWLPNEALSHIGKKAATNQQAVEDSQKYEYNDDQWDSLLNEI